MNRRQGARDRAFQARLLAAAIAVASVPAAVLAQHGGHGGGAWPSHRDEPSQPPPRRREVEPPPQRPAKPPAIYVFVEKGAFWPREFAVKRNVATEIFVLRRDDTCPTALEIPQLNVRVPLPLGAPVQFRIEAAERGTFPFVCEGSDVGGSVVVE